MEQTVQRERKIRIIPATKPVSAPGRASGRRQRVAAYCRVSTDSEEQLTSYTAQKAYYTQKIDENPDWEMAGIFADKGITGTSAVHPLPFGNIVHIRSAMCGEAFLRQPPFRPAGPAGRCSRIPESTAAPDPTPPAAPAAAGGTLHPATPLAAAPPLAESRTVWLYLPTA